MCCRIRWGPLGGRCRRLAYSLLTRPHAVVNMRIMARIGAPVFAEIDKDEKRGVPCMHTVGAPLAPDEQDVPWPCNDEKYIVHFPETREIWSYGSGYGGNALLGIAAFFYFRNIPRSPVFYTSVPLTSYVGSEICPSPGRSGFPS